MNRKEKTQVSKYFIVLQAGTIDTLLPKGKEKSIKTTFVTAFLIIFFLISKTFPFFGSFFIYNRQGSNKHVQFS